MFLSDVNELLGCLLGFSIFLVVELVVVMLEISLALFQNRLRRGRKKDYIAANFKSINFWINGHSIL